MLFKLRINFNRKSVVKKEIKRSTLNFRQKTKNNIFVSFKIALKFYNISVCICCILSYGLVSTLVTYKYISQTHDL